MMYLIIEEKKSNKKIKLFSNKAERAIDYITTKYESEAEFLESIGLNPDNYSAYKNYNDGNSNIDFDFLPKDYEGIFDIIDSEANQDRFINTICNSDLDVMRIYSCSVFYGRSKFRNNTYLWETNNNIQDVIVCQDFLKDSYKTGDEEKINREKQKYKESLELFLYYKAKPVYNNFLSAYKYMCDKNIIEKKNAYKEDLVKSYLSYEFRKSLTEQINKDGNFKSSLPKEELITFDQLKESVESLRRKSKEELIDPNVNSQQFYTAITENEDRDIDDFERDLDILMDEEGLSDNEKITVRATMRDNYERKINKVNKI